jgi:hypothetical protein
VRDVVHALPKEKLANQTLKLHYYKVEHDPEEYNYAHTEIRVYKDGVRVKKSSQIGELAKKEFRQIISDRAFVLLNPTVVA